MAVEGPVTVPPTDRAFWPLTALVPLRESEVRSPLGPSVPCHTRLVSVSALACLVFSLCETKDHLRRCVLSLVVKVLKAVKMQKKRRLKYQNDSDVFEKDFCIPK